VEAAEAAAVVAVDSGAETEVAAVEVEAAETEAAGAAVASGVETVDLAETAVDEVVAPCVVEAEIEEGRSNPFLPSILL
jgi:hypothetical protein